jgi:energy-coupling factor transport system substrate-specific component
MRFGKSIDSKRIAVLAVLIALNAAIRTLGAGTAGLETAFFVILIGGFAMGASFGFTLGAGSILLSALCFAGYGPWLPMQMATAGLLGLLAGLLPKPKTSRRKVLLLCLFAIPMSYLYGILLSLWYWPFMVAGGTSVSIDTGATLWVNVRHFVGYELLSGGLVWDTGRAATTVTLIALTAPALLNTLERVSRRAGVTV